MHIDRHVILASTLAVLIAGFILAIPTGAATAQPVKQRLLQQQEQMRKKKMMEEQQQVQPPAKSETPAAAQSIGDDKSANQGRHEEAQSIYRNLRIEQKLTHDAALSALKSSGFPTDQIVEIP